MKFVYLSYHLSLVRTILVLKGTCSLQRLHQLRLWYGRHWYTRGDEACHVLARTSIVKTAGSSSGEAISEAHLCVGKAQGLSMKSLDWELALARSSNKDYGE